MEITKEQLLQIINKCFNLGQSGWNSEGDRCKYREMILTYIQNELKIDIKNNSFKEDTVEIFLDDNRKLDIRPALNIDECIKQGFKKMCFPYTMLINDFNLSISKGQNAIDFLKKDLADNILRYEKTFDVSIKELIHYNSEIYWK